MTRIDKTLPTIPAKRYFSMAELCYLAQVSKEEFLQWQKEHGILGHGGNVFHRQDVITVRRLRATFLPFVDPFTENYSAENGEPTISAREAKQHLQDILHGIETALAI